MEKLLSPNDPQAVEIYNKTALGTTPVLLVCDHASRAMPEKLGDMGLTDPNDLTRHIAWDIGAKDITMWLADQLNAPALLAGLSRLVFDVNRATDHEKAIPEISDNTAIPANQNLTPEQRRQRIDEIYTPYHDTFTQALKDIEAAGLQPFVISIHSFTPEMKGEERETEIGILWDSNKEIAHKMMYNLRAQNPDLVIGSNDPYSFIEDAALNHSLRCHDIHKGKNYMLAEFRQDLVGTQADAEKYAEIFLNALKPLL